jgi:riboflavin biosynthesis pyrimidine reductase
VTVQQRIADLYGDVDLARESGVVHVVSVCDRGDGMLTVIRIGPCAPKSATDTFVLNLARARADAIIVTGKILRAEPALRYDLPADLLQWRRDHAGLVQRPDLIVLTRGHDLQPTHPALHGWARPIVFTTEDAARRSTMVDVVGHSNPSIRSAIAWARDNGARVVSIEAGPSTTRTLYEPPIAVDELMLSEFLGEIPDEARGGVLLRRDALETKLRAVAPPREVQEGSGPWRFGRWTRDRRM